MLDLALLSCQSMPVGSEFINARGRNQVNCSISTYGEESTSGCCLLHIGAFETLLLFFKV